MPRILRPTVAALALVLLTPAAASSDSWLTADDRRDVVGYSWDPEPQPCGTSTDVDSSAETNVDITGLGVRHTRRAVVITTRFRDLGSAHGQTVDLAVRSSTGGWELGFYRLDPDDGGWDTFTDLTTEPDYPDPDDVPECGSFIIDSDWIPCRIGRDVDFAKNLIRLSVPRNCMRNPRWVRVGVNTYDFIDDGSGSYTYFWDEWDGGTAVSPWLPPIGPRVRATAGAPIGATRTDTSRGQERHFVVRRDGIFTGR